jgi:hypothetical protein
VTTNGAVDSGSPRRDASLAVAPACSPMTIYEIAISNTDVPSVRMIMMIYEEPVTRAGISVPFSNANPKVVDSQGFTKNGYPSRLPLFPPLACVFSGEWTAASDGRILTRRPRILFRRSSMLSVPCCWITSYYVRPWRHQAWPGQPSPLTEALGRATRDQSLSYGPAAT